MGGNTIQFRIADSFTESLGRLTNDEQKAVKTTAFDLQMNPANPGIQLHRIDRARDKNFWSARASSDLRLILHRSGDSLLACFVGHHDDAYHWAERRKLETHPRTGAAQLVEVRETVKEVVVPVYVEGAAESYRKTPLFADTSEDDLLGYGVPEDWLEDVKAADEDSLLAVADHLPSEAAEALLELATGGTPKPRHALAGQESPFEHPDARRRFQLVTDSEELRRALDYPWERWTVFLHPEQREWVERDYSGPARVSGSAGTGKTVVALHRAAYLARFNPDSRVLLGTFSDPLANALEVKLRRLIGDQPLLGERIDVSSLDSLVLRLHKARIGPVRLVDENTLREVLAAAAGDDSRFSQHFLEAEWSQVVDPWQLDTWEAYRDVARLGRKTRLPEAQRERLWSIFERARADLRGKGLKTLAEVYGALEALFREGAGSPYDFVVIDEAQDLSVPQLRFLAALGGNRPNALFFAGDLGQRIFQQPFSWKSLGVDIRGRSRTLRVNYRTSHQIRQQADRLLGPEITDVDGNTEDRRGTVSVFNGPEPKIREYATEEEEIAAVADWLVAQTAEGMAPRELAVFVRSPAQLDRAKAALAAANLEFQVLDEHMKATGDKAAAATMHLAKGLEFRAVAVMACDDEVLPLQSRIEAVGDTADLEDVYDTERHLLYVACTRARDALMVSGVDSVSEFLYDLMGQ